ncbi:MAG: hypothetical protein HY901_35495 [Deltaproteobacteria bacterium]|nr:hypothetical protein [Deltaproteobacteria bacterium]
MSVHVPHDEGVLVRLGRLLDAALRNLAASPTPEQLEALAVLVHETMSGRGRSFHCLKHVFDLATGPDPHLALGAAFHDTVYLQVDGGLSPRVEQLLGGAFEHRGEQVFLTEPGPDRLRAMVLALFGIAPGDPVAPTAGLNELLSALLAVRALHGLLPVKDLVRVAASVEATVPFRGPAAPEQQRERLASLSKAMGLALSTEELDAMVLTGVDLANKDVANFALTDPALFLDNTWALLPETNWSLRMRSVYSVREYRGAMLRMASFLSALDPARIFRSYRGWPAPSAIDELQGLARRNLRISAHYLGAKLLAACSLDALATLSGGDAPVAMLMGELPSEAGEPLRMEHFLPPLEAPAEADPEVWRLLAEGRAHHTGFDLRNAPLAAHLYSKIGAAGSNRMVEACRAYCEGKTTPTQLLKATLTAPVAATVARACARVAFFRTERLEAVARMLEDGIDPRDS